MTRPVWTEVLRRHGFTRLSTATRTRYYRKEHLVIIARPAAGRDAFSGGYVLLAGPDADYQPRWEPLRELGPMAQTVRFALTAAFGGEQTVNWCDRIVRVRLDHVGSWLVPTVRVAAWKWYERTSRKPLAIGSLTDDHALALARAVIAQTAPLEPLIDYLLETKAGSGIARFLARTKVRFDLAARKLPS